MHHPPSIQDKKKLNFVTNNCKINNKGEYDDLQLYVM